MSIQFNKSDGPTLGVEVELQIVDLESRKLVPLAPELLAAANNPHIKTELLQSTIELNTSVCRDVKEVRNDLMDLKEVVQSICENLGCGLISSGTHPFSTWTEQLTTDEERYQQLVDRVQWPAQRLMIFGLHVHVGMDSGEKAVAVFDQLSNYIPQFLALSASSPFWQGNDTGLASVRTKVFETLPTAGLPEQLVNWGEFQAFMMPPARLTAFVKFGGTSGRIRDLERWKCACAMGPPRWASYWLSQRSCIALRFGCPRNMRTVIYGRPRGIGFSEKINGVPHAGAWRHSSFRMMKAIR